MFRKLLLSAVLAAAPTMAHAEWYEAGSEHFVVYADENPDKLKTYTERLERFDRTLRFITGTPDKPISPQMRVHVFVVANVAEIQKLYGGKGPAGFFIARASGPTAFVPKGEGGGGLDAQTILQHEYGHSFMFSTWPSVVFPKWFVEGFAEFVGTAFYRANGTLIIGKAPEYRAYGVDRTSAMPAARLLLLDPKDRDIDTQTLYGRGWLLTHYSILGGHSDQFVNYLKAVNAGKPIAEANQAFGELGKLDAQMNAYAQRSTLPTIAVPAEKVPVGQVTLRKLTPGEAATIKTRIYSQRGVDAKLGATVVGWARAAAAPYPADAAAQNVLAEAEFDVENYAAAEAAADRALAADPKSVHALLYKGMAQIEAARAAKSTDAARWKAARGWFVKANRLDPDYPEPLIQYYRSFRAAGEAPGRSAQDGLISAYVHAPFDDGLRMQAGTVLLQQNNVSAARVAFEKIAYGPHGGDMQAFAIKVLAALESGGSEAALKALSSGQPDAGKADDVKKKDD